MAPMPKILLFCRQLDRVSALAETLGGKFDVVSSESVENSLERPDRNAIPQTANGETLVAPTELPVLEGCCTVMRPAFTKR